jgi:L,D-peptidoglycan transpeptidase YkuD (ErfK/YbiS/YcfS/YnhG family)
MPAQKRGERSAVQVIHVHRSPLDHWRGVLTAGGLRVPCAIGRGGTTHCKREGDGGSPIGRFRLLRAYYRPDRLPRPYTRLPLRGIQPHDGWCDDPGHRLYNRLIRLPFSGSHERMWRDDFLYDIVIDIAWNRGPIRKGRGSAIFLHLRPADGGPTAGCVAVDRRGMRRLLAMLSPRAVLRIH